MADKELKVVYRKADELVVPDYNPRKITARQRADIKRSLEEYGMVQPLVVNTYKDEENGIDRTGVIIGGNQRFKIMESMGYESFPCVEVCLDPENEKKLNLRLNKNQAEFDFDMLKELFEHDMLIDVGFDENEIGKVLETYEETFKEVDNTTCEMPIVQKFNEKYRTVMIFCNNEMDFNWLRNVMRLESKKDYSNSKIGEALVLTVQDFQKVWEEATENVREEDEQQD